MLESVNHFVHLNLSFTLLAAFVVFVLGIELGNRTTVRKIDYYVYKQPVDRFMKL